jgi:hypothetical protein
MLVVQLLSGKFSIFRLSDLAIEAVSADLTPVERGLLPLLQFGPSV